MLNRIFYILLTVMLISCGTAEKKADASGQNKPEVEVPDFNADSCMKFLKAQVDFGPRVPGTVQHRNTCDYLKGILNGYTADVTVQQESTVTAKGEKIPVYNIFARFGQQKNRILLLAHWDTRPWADEDPTPTAHSKPIDGANDGASGVAVLLELARLMSEKCPANVGVDILLVDAEDSGVEGDDESWCLGTKIWVKNSPYSSAEMPEYAILLDMVGGRDAVFHREFFSDYYARSIVDKVWSMAMSSGYSSRFVNQTGGAITDDHVVLNKNGIRTIDIIENNNSQTGSFNPTWHTLDDNIRNIDPATLKAVGQVVANCIYNHKK